MGEQFLEITEKREVDAIIARVAAEVATARAKADAAVEKVNVAEALGRVAAVAVFSALDVPPFDRAIMDGYAVVASDTFYADEDNPASLIVNGLIFAGELPKQSVEPGYCSGISTGAPLPKGANATVKVENTAEYTEVIEGEERTKVKIYKPVAPGENIMRVGSDIKRGEQLIRRGTTLTPRDTGVLAACGLNEVMARRKPTVALTSTGNELTAPGETLEPAKIYDVNAQTLSDSVRECGCTPYFLGIVRDDIEEISGKLGESLEKGVDVIIVSGGTSAGVGDLLPKVVEERGEILVHGVDIKPGKPFIFGTIQGKPFFGLPGNPTSALITFNLFVAPLLRVLSGRARDYEEAKRRAGKGIKAKAAMRIFSDKGRNEYVLVTIGPTENAEEAAFLAYPILTGSGAITTLSKADGYLFMAKGKEIIEEGEPVEVAVLTELPRS
ncbi:MAG: molybdopterin molybdenumtransferase MoeA [Methanomicrobia archaeon]|nr:molybdopterin molybdenumtransferase MoeA [Methanomicrobia archaeon]